MKRSLRRMRVVPCADVVVALTTPHPDLDYLPNRLDQLVELAPRSSAIAAQRSVAFADCLREPFIRLQEGAALHTFLMNQAAALGGLDLRVQVSGYRSVARLLAGASALACTTSSGLRATRSVEFVQLVLCEQYQPTGAKQRLKPHPVPGPRDDVNKARSPSRSRGNGALRTSAMRVPSAMAFDSRPVSPQRASLPPGDHAAQSQRNIRVNPHHRRGAPNAP